ncbi:MAG: hypothetical protein ACLU4N_20205 [Butyricimonas faecihominis]
MHGVGNVIGTRRWSLYQYCEEDAYIDDEVMRFWLNQQLLKDPGARKYVFYYAAKMLNKMMPGEKHNRC